MKEEVHSAKKARLIKKEMGADEEEKEPIQLLWAIHGKLVEREKVYLKEAKKKRNQALLNLLMIKQQLLLRQ